MRPIYQKLGAQKWGESSREVAGRTTDEEHGNEKSQPMGQDWLAGGLLPADAAEVLEDVG